MFDSFHGKHSRLQYQVISEQPKWAMEKIGEIQGLSEKATQWRPVQVS